MTTYAAAPRPALVLLAAAGAIDLAQLTALVSGADDAPVGVILLVAGLGLLTLVGVAMAWRGSRAGLITAAAARIGGIAMGIPAYFLDAPLFVRILVTAMLVLTVAGLWLAAPGLRRTRPRVA
jgi:hypothetical protein